MTTLHEFTITFDPDDLILALANFMKHQESENMKEATNNDIPTVA